MVQLISPQQKQLSAYSYGWTDLGTVSVQYNMVNMAIFFFFLVLTIDHDLAMRKSYGLSVVSYKYRQTSNISHT